MKRSEELGRNQAIIGLALPLPCSTAMRATSSMPCAAATRPATSWPPPASTCRRRSPPPANAWPRPGSTWKACARTSCPAPRAPTTRPARV
jgi:hypothetical protein